MYYPPLGDNQDWSNAPPPGERSDHGAPGHGLFLGSIADAIDMGTTYLPVYAISDLSIYEKWFHYSSADGQPFGWITKCLLSDRRRIVYAHLQNCPAKDTYSKGEQIDIISDILNYDHLHFEMEGVVAGDMPFLFATEVKNVTRDEVIWAYRYYLGRDPDNEQIIAERVASQTIEQVKTDVRNSPERREIVRGLYRKYLHEPSENEVSMYAEADLSIDQISQTFRTSDEMIQGIRQAIWDIQSKVDSILKAVTELQDIAKKGGFTTTPVSQFSEEEVSWIRKLIDVFRFWK